jgi:hypothetical protein
MKTQTFFSAITATLLIGILALPSALFAKGDFSKPIKKEFNINKNATLNIDCEFTDIKAFNWNKDVISVEVTVTVDAGSEKQAASRFEKVNVILDGTPSLVNLKTSLNNDYFGGNNNNVDIDVVIYYPAHIQLILNNEFGHCVFQDIEGKATIEMEYGNFDAQNLTSTELDIDMEFGQIKVGRFQGGKIEVSYGGFTTQVAGILTLDSEFSGNEIDHVDHLEMETSYDKNSFGTIRKAIVVSEFSSNKIDLLQKYLDMRISYGSLNVKQIENAFEMITINSEFSGVDLTFTNPANFAFKASIEMGNFNYAKDIAKITLLEKEMFDLELEGYFGQAKGQTPKLIVNISNANANINFK